MSFLDITSDLGSSLRGTADQIADVLRGGRKSATAFFAGPTIPIPVQDLNRREKAGLAFGVFRLTNLLQQLPVTTVPVAASIAFAPAVLHTGSYQLYDIGLNPDKVLARGQWHRLITSQLVNATAVQLIDNAGDLYESCSWLEKSWGWRGLLGAVGAVSTLGPALYVALTAFAQRVFPFSPLAQQYYSSYYVSPSMLALGISVLSGYDKDVFDALAQGGGSGGNHESSQIWGARYVWCGRLLLTTFLAPRDSHMEPNISGIIAGLICVYTFGAANPRWRRRGGLGWTDIAIQGAFLGVLGAVSYFSSKNTANMRALN